MILFEKPSRTTLKTSTSSNEFRHKLIRSLEPLKRTYPNVFVPDQVAPSFSLGLQPYLEHQSHHHPNHQALLSASTASLNPSWLYAASLAPHSTSFFKFLFAFVSGGLFFTTAVAALASCYAVGVGNVRRFADILFVVLQRVWITFTFGLGATKLALMGEVEDKRNWKWKSAWAVLKEKLQETRETAVLGVQALRQEAKLYTAAVGAPGLIPLQYMLDRMMPHSLANMLEDSMKEALASMPKQKTVKKMTLSSFQVGEVTPVLEAARVYDVPDVMAFDYDVKWQSQITATVQVKTTFAQVPIVLKNFKFDGVVRIILTPLTKEAPGYGAMLMSLPSTPKISLDVSVLGGDIPFLKQEITSALHKSMADEWLWPRRNVVPSMKDGGSNPILPREVLETLKITDPLLQAEQALQAQQPILKGLRENDTTIDEEQQQKMVNILVKDRTNSPSKLEEKKGNNYETGLDPAIHFPDINSGGDTGKRNWWDSIVQSSFQVNSSKYNSEKQSKIDAEAIKQGTVTSTEEATKPGDEANTKDSVGVSGKEIGHDTGRLQFGWFHQRFRAARS